MPLTSYAVNEDNSRGRQHRITLAHDRNAFQRDYTRVLHSSAFRRLSGKTQVFSAILGDQFRTRMTHSLEVEQVARSIARRLNLNDDLAGVLAISHDIGHAPFGHTGQDVLNDLMKDHGGFEHNAQALRLVDELESPYRHHRGLNLMFETREGLLKHCTPTRAQALGPIAARHLDGRSSTLEAQVVDWADAIAYTHADLEDAFKMGVLSLDELVQAPGYKETFERIQQRDGHTQPPTPADLKAGGERGRQAKALIQEVLREMMSEAIDDLVVSTRAALEGSRIRTLDDVRKSKPLVQFSPAMRAQHTALKRFSRTTIYSHPRIEEMRQQHSIVLRDLFAIYERQPQVLGGNSSEETNLYRRIADHISGMTDRFAIDEHARLLALYPKQELRAPMIRKAVSMS
jgi:dGTPase